MSDQQETYNFELTFNFEDGTYKVYQFLGMENWFTDKGFIIFVQEGLNQTYVKIPDNITMFEVTECQN